MALLDCLLMRDLKFAGLAAFMTAYKLGYCLEKEEKGRERKRKQKKMGKCQFSNHFKFILYVHWGV